MTVEGIDLFTTAQVVAATSLIAHFCLLRPRNARADLLLTVEMIDKDLAGEIDRGSLSVGDPLVADLQRCLSLSRKRSDAAESVTNLNALLHPAVSGPAPSTRRLDWLDQFERPDQVPPAQQQLMPAERNILLEYSAELSAATSAYLRLTRLTRLGWLSRSVRRSPIDVTQSASRSVPAAPPAVPSWRRSPLGLDDGSGESVRHGKQGRGGWPHTRHPRHPRNVPAGQWPSEQAEGRRILDLSTDVAYDSLYDNRAHDRLSLDRASLDRLAHNRLMYGNGPFDNPS
jgi:hypothetical protein